MPVLRGLIQVAGLLELLELLLDRLGSQRRGNWFRTRPPSWATAVNARTSDSQRCQQYGQSRFSDTTR